MPWKRRCPATKISPGAWLALLPGLCALLSTDLANAEEPTVPPRLIRHIVVEGLWRTERDVVVRELALPSGALLEDHQIAEALQRLRNTGLFRAVEARFYATDVPCDVPRLTEDGASATVAEPCPHAQSHGPVSQVGEVLHIVVDERWAIVPNVRFGLGGGTTRLVLGLMDANVLGRMWQAGGRYERFGSENSWHLWAREPRLLGRRLSLSTSAGQARRRVALASPEDGVEGYGRTESYAGLGLWGEWTPRVATGAELWWSHEAFDYARAGEEEGDGASLDRQRWPRERTTMPVELWARLGRIDEDNYQVRGAALRVTLGADVPVSGDVPTGLPMRAVLGAAGYHVLPKRVNLAGRAVVGVMGEDAVARQFRLGGLDAVRGFGSEAFRGTHYWLVGGEVRTALVDTRWLVVQPAVFVDAIGAGQGAPGLAALSGLGAGGGVRIIIPKIYGFIMRLDYGVGLVGPGQSGWNLGGGQFY